MPRPHRITARLLALLVLGLAGLPVDAAPPAAGDRVARRVERAEALERSGDKAGARGELDAAIAEAPDHAGGWLARAGLRSRASDRDGAASDLERAMALAPADPEVRLARAQFRDDAGDFDGALEDLDAGLVARPGDLPSRRLRAKVQVARGNYAAAEADLAFVKRRDPRDPAVATLHALAIVLQDRRKEGLAAFARLQPTLGSNQRFLRLKAAAHASLGETEPALAALGRAVQAPGAERAAAKLERGFLLLAAGNYASALEDLRGALDLEREPTQRVRVRLWLGLALERLGRRTEAMPILEAGLRESLELPGRPGEVYAVLFRCSLGELPVAALLAEAPDPLAGPSEYCMNRFYASHVLLGADRFDEASVLLREALLTGRRHLLEWQGARLTLEAFVQPVLDRLGATPSPAPP